MTSERLARLFGFFWTGNRVFLCIVRGGSNLRFKNPNLTLAQTLWSIAWVMMLTYFLDDAGPAALMLCLLVVHFGALRLILARLTGLSRIAIATHAQVIDFLSRCQPGMFELKTERLIGHGLAAALLGSTFVGHGMFMLRGALRDRCRNLEQTLGKVNRLASTDQPIGA